MIFVVEIARLRALVGGALDNRRGFEGVETALSLVDPYWSSTFMGDSTMCREDGKGMEGREGVERVVERAERSYIDLLASFRRAEVGGMERPGVSPQRDMREPIDGRRWKGCGI